MPAIELTQEMTLALAAVIGALATLLLVGLGRLLWMRMAVRRCRLTDLPALTQQLQAQQIVIGSLGDRLQRLVDELNLDGRHTAVPERGARVGYALAIRLAHEGATPEEISGSCGMSDREAQLVRRLHTGSMREVRGVS